MNESRSQFIDKVIRPGPYKELLPCEDLCYGLVRSCPARLGFSCPLEGHGLNYTYGKIDRAGQDQWTCNIPGLDLNAASLLQQPFLQAAFVAVTTALWLSAT